ncbi:hypothetical protein NSPZN2_50300 [Nitrospira defluvii]|uniref:Uncharacterized protein n=1 Tax=Nitrospira defluvii TaxID=330214 RepID=A0ABM8S5D6_9BACT|nr:hypothetical protein NSPZN2_50300 [Nitrospira defluvii]
MKIHFNGVVGSNNVTGGGSVMHQEPVMALVMGSGANINGRLVSTFLTGRSGRSDFLPMREPLVAIILPRDGHCVQRQLELRAASQII